MGCNRSKPKFSFSKFLTPGAFKGVAFEKHEPHVAFVKPLRRHRERSEAIQRPTNLRSVCGGLLDRSTYIARDVGRGGPGIRTSSREATSSGGLRGEPA
jgi:hypothetical protein